MILCSFALKVQDGRFLRNTVYWWIKNEVCCLWDVQLICMPALTAVGQLFLQDKAPVLALSYITPGFH